jgi:hypothetical protein
MEHTWHVAILSACIVVLFLFLVRLSFFFIDGLLIYIDKKKKGCNLVLCPKCKEHYCWTKEDGKTVIYCYECGFLFDWRAGLSEREALFRKLDEEDEA